MGASTFLYSSLAKNSYNMVSWKFEHPRIRGMMLHATIGDGCDNADYRSA